MFLIFHAKIYANRSLANRELSKKHCATNSNILRSTAV